MSTALPRFGTLMVLTAVLGCAADAPSPPTASLAPIGPQTQPPAAPPAETVPSALAPAPDLPEAPRVTDYLAVAARNSPALMAAFNAWRAALERAPQVRALPDPQVTYAHYIQEVETRVGPQRNRVQIAQTFPWPAKLQLREDAAMQAARAARLRCDAAKLRLFHQVKAAYSEYYFCGRALAVTEENLRLLQHLESVVRTRYRGDDAGRKDLLRLQVELGKIEDRLRGLQDLRAPLNQRLWAALGTPATRTLPFPDRLEPADTACDDANLLAWAAEANPELKALDADAGEQKRKVELAEKQALPDLTVGVTWIDTGHARGAVQPPDSGRDPLVASVSVSVPLWWERIHAGVREARFRHVAALKQRADKANDLAAQVKRAAYLYRDAQRRIDLYDRVLVPRATESLKVTERAFVAGKADFGDLVDAQRVLLELQLTRERALADRAIRLATLERMVARPLPKTGAPSPTSRPAD